MVTIRLAQWMSEAVDRREREPLHLMKAKLKDLVEVPHSTEVSLTNRIRAASEEILGSSTHFGSLRWAR